MLEENFVERRQMFVKLLNKFWELLVDNPLRQGA